MKAIVFLAAILMLSGLPQTTQSPVKNEQEHSKKEAKPPNKNPSSVAKPTSPVTTPISQPTPNPQASDTKEKAGSWPPRTDIFWPTWLLVIVTAIAVAAALKTLGAINAQVAEMRATGIQTDRLISENIAQSTSMQKSVAEATRLASAMEVVAKEIAISSEAATASVSAINKQMRAYLSVIIGSAIFQERQKGLKFEGKPTVINTGNTPAKNVSYRASAAIVKLPFADDFTFPLTTERKSTATIGAHQNAMLSAIVDDFIDDAEVEDVKVGKGEKCLCVWGVVTYDDVFGEHQTSKFCQSLLWFADGKTIYGYYYPHHNETT
jgi:hypothetical protein